MFGNRRELESYCQDYVTLLRQVCRVFRRDFIQFCKIDVFLEFFKIASVCIRLLRKRFLKPGNICIIPTGGFSGNVNYSEKTLMWLVYREIMDGGLNLLHGCNRREYRLP